MFSVLQKNIDFNNEFYVHLLCELFVMLNYDEMNYNLISGVFTKYFEVQIIVTCTNHESDVEMNFSVKFVETQNKNNEHMHVK